MLKFEDPGADLSRAAVSFGGVQHIGRGGQLCSCRRATTCSALTEARKVTGSFGQATSSLQSRTCNDDIANFDTASVAISYRRMGSVAARSCISSHCAAANSTRIRAMAPSTVSPLRSDGSDLGRASSSVLGDKDPI